MVAVSACMGGTRGSGVLSSTGDVLEMSMVRGVGGVCDMCMYLDRGWVEIAAVCDRCDSSTACRFCRLEPLL